MKITGVVDAGAARGVGGDWAVAGIDVVLVANGRAAGDFFVMGAGVETLAG